MGTDSYAGESADCVETFSSVVGPVPYPTTGRNKDRREEELEIPLVMCHVSAFAPKRRKRKIMKSIKKNKEEKSYRQIKIS